MDWFILAWSPLWFTWDLINNMIILMATRRWINGGVTQTKNQVMAEMKDPKNAKELRTAWDIPTRAEIKETMTAAISTIAFPPIPSVDLSPIEAKIAAISDQGAELKAALALLEAKLTKIEAEGLQVDLDMEDLNKRIVKAATSAYGVTVREDNKAKDDFIAEYKSSVYGQADQKLIYDQLIKLGIPPGAAEVAAVQGPTAVRWITEEFLGKKKAAELAAAWERGRGAALVQVVGK